MYLAFEVRSKIVCKDGKQQHRKERVLAWGGRGRGGSCRVAAREGSWM